MYKVEVPPPTVESALLSIADALHKIAAELKRKNDAEIQEMAVGGLYDDWDEIPF